MVSFSYGSFNEIYEESSKVVAIGFSVTKGPTFWSVLIVSAPAKDRTF